MLADEAVQGRDDLDQYQVLHFATPGLEEGVWGCAKSPPALITSIQDENSDGLLSFDEIAKLRLDANLVVLSACETASGVKDEALARQSGQEEAGSTLEGLVRAFLTANARAVLATYWQVSADEETNELVRTLYTSARQQTIGASLQTLYTDPGGSSVIAARAVARATSPTKVKSRIWRPSPNSSNVVPSWAAAMRRWIAMSGRWAGPNTVK